jgi:GNAT superfamily N-acetyltransferase
VPSEPVLLAGHHDTSHFDCGVQQLDDFLKRFAIANQKGGAARTYVCIEDRRVVGYYSLAPAGVAPSEVPDRVMKGQPQHPVPCILLAKLAVDRCAQGQGLGKYLFRDSLLRAFRAHEEIGGRAFLVHATNDEARAFYVKYGMLPSPTHPMHLFVLFKDVRAILAGPSV